MLVTEWNFEFTRGRKFQSKATGRRSPLDPEECINFERRLDSFVLQTQDILRSLTVDDQYLFKYLFIDLKKQSVSSTNFACRILVGQNISESNGDNCLAMPNVFKHISSNSVSIIFL